MSYKKKKTVIRVLSDISRKESSSLTGYQTSNLVHSINDNQTSLDKVDKLTQQLNMKEKRTLTWRRRPNIYSVNKSAWGPRGDRYGPAMAGDRGPLPIFIGPRSALPLDRSWSLAWTKTGLFSWTWGSPHYRSKRTTVRSFGANMARALRRRVVALVRVSGGWASSL